jgi:hypothetical protein
MEMVSSVGQVEEPDEFSHPRAKHAFFSSLARRSVLKWRSKEIAVASFSQPLDRA